MQFRMTFDVVADPSLFRGAVRFETGQKDAIDGMMVD